MTTRSRTVSRKDFIFKKSRPGYFSPKSAATTDDQTSQLASYHPDNLGSRYSLIVRALRPTCPNPRINRTDSTADQRFPGVNPNHECALVNLPMPHSGSNSRGPNPLKSDWAQLWIVAPSQFLMGLQVQIAHQKMQRRPAAHCRTRFMSHSTTLPISEQDRTASSLSSVLLAWVQLVGDLWNPKKPVHLSALS
jgi:hypothetical protein